MANLILIRELCERKKMTIRELAQKIGRDESSIQSSIRRGSTNTKTLEAIAAQLGVPVGVFFDGYGSDELVELRKENCHLSELLREKERTIEILMSDRLGKKSPVEDTNTAQ